MAAAANGHKEVLELLIENGASLDLKSEAKTTCLDRWLAGSPPCPDILEYGVK